MPVYRVVLTGADDNTDLQMLETLAQHSTLVELGFLYQTNEDNKPIVKARYCSWDFLKKVESLNIKRSIHLCGNAVQQATSKIFLPDENTPEILNWLNRYDRVQLNFNPEYQGVLSEVYSFVMNIQVRMVLQNNSLNSSLISNISPLLKSDDMELLYDSSLGRGKLANSYKPISGKFQTGYAGGFTVDNLAEELEKIEQVNKGKNFYIDLESGLRGEFNVFSISKCYEILSIVNTHNEKYKR